jgi:serine/threonine protein kinase
MEVPHPHPDIVLNDYIVESPDDNRLGQGGFGNVFRGRHKINTSEEVAVKQIDSRTCLSRWLDREKDFAIKLKSNGHENVIKFFDTGSVGRFVYFIMELCCMNLNELFKKAERKFNGVECLIFKNNMANGVQFLHHLKICHRDLKPLNILVKGNTVKIGDLGHARELSFSSSASSRVTHKLTARIGTEGWRAPEITPTRKADYKFPVDVFSLALIFLAMLRHKIGKSLIPHTVNDIHLGVWMRARDQEVPDLRDSADEMLVDDLIRMITMMLSLKPKNRIDIHKVCQRIKEITEAAERRRTESRKRAAQPCDESPSSTDPTPRTPQGGARPKVLKQSFKKPGMPAGPQPRKPGPSPGPSGDRDPGRNIHRSPSAGVPTSLTPITHHELSFEGDWNAGFSSDGSIVLASESDPSHLYMYRHNDGNYAEVRKKPLPAGLDYDCTTCNKAINKTIIALQNYCSATTIHYSHSLEVHHTSQHKGNLLDLWDDGCTGYVRAAADGNGRVIDVYDNNQKRVVTLQPPAGCKWEVFLSVCKLRDGFAVVDQLSKSLTVFDTEGKLVSQRTLPYVPSYLKAVTSCGERHLAVAGWLPPSIHVYTRDAEEVLSISAATLQLPASAESLDGIRYSDSGVLHVAAGDGHNISSLHAYKVEFSDTS